MPIYEFVCDTCRAEFEKIVLSRSAEIACPKCGSLGITRQASTFAFKSAGGRFVSSSTQTSGCGGCQPGTACAGCRR